MLSIGALRNALTGPWVSNELWKNARAVPSLDLRFADNKSLVDAKTGASLVTFTRASSSTYVGSDGLIKTATTNEARFDHNPTTGESFGLLVEEARTNLVTWSQDLSNADWTKAASTIVSTAVASPIQGVNYQKIEATSANTTIGVTSIAVTAATQQRAVSFFAQPLGNISRVLVVIQGSDARINVNLVDGTFTTNATATGSTVSVSGQRFSVSTPTLTLATGVRFFLKRTGETDTNTPTTIAIGEGLYLTGAQMETGAFHTSYIPTTTATVTRAADVASITGTNFSSWYNQTEGTVFANYAERAFSVTHQVATVSNGTANERISLAINSSNILDVGVISGGTDTFSGNTPTLTAQEYQIGFGYRADNSGVSANGSAITVDSAVTLPTVSQLDVGARAGTSQLVNSTIKRLTYWPVRLPDPTLQSITTP